jgi:hypothetical protein
MPEKHLFAFTFIDLPCRLELVTGNEAALEPLHRFLQMFPQFAADSGQPPRFTVRIHDLAGHRSELAPDDPVFAQMREYFAAAYGLANSELVDRICSPAFVPDAAVRQVVVDALGLPEEKGLSLQKDFLVCSDRSGGLVEAFADVGSSLQEAWPFHVLNFFKIFFFGMGVVRLHGSGATAGQSAILLLANTGGGKSTMKNLFLRNLPAAQAFTDDSILAVRTSEGFRLYQDPVEFVRWCLLPANTLGDHAIPEPRSAITAMPAVYYLNKDSVTRWHECQPGEVFDRINSEAFFQQGFLTQRFIPQPDSERFLHEYFANSRELLGECRCHLASIRYNDDYDGLFQQWRHDLRLTGHDNVSSTPAAPA